MFAQVNANWYIAITFFIFRTERIEAREREDNWRKDEKPEGGSWRARSVNAKLFRFRLDADGGDLDEENSCNIFVLKY